MKYKTIGAHVPLETAEALEKKAEKTNISLSKYVSLVCQRWIKEGKDIIIREK